MKYMKYLFLSLAITFLTSSFGVFADNYPYYFNEIIPANNGAKYSLAKIKDELTTQEIRYVAVENNEILDIMLMQETGAYMSNWRILETGEDIVYSNSRAMWIGDKYKLKVDSAVLRFHTTAVSFQWYIH